MSIASHGLRRRAGKRQGQVLGRESPNNPTTHAQEELNKMSTWPSAYIALEIVTSMAQHAMSFTNQMQFFLAITSYSHMTYHTL